MEFRPDSVYVYGEPSQIDNISKVFTRNVTLGALSADVHGSVGIEPVKGVRMSQTSVDYSVSVSRYVTETVSLPVRVRNLPAGKEIAVYPSVVNAGFLLPWILARWMCLMLITTTLNSQEALSASFGRRLCRTACSESAPRPRSWIA